MLSFNETSYENSIIELFENLGYKHIYGPDVNTHPEIPLMLDELQTALGRINPFLPADAIKEAIFKIRNTIYVGQVLKIPNR